MRTPDSSAATGWDSTWSNGRARSARGAKVLSGRSMFVGVTWAYVGAIVLGPLLALIFQGMDVGLARLLRALTSNVALEALSLSLALVGIALVVNAVLGLVGGIVLVRHRFWGRGIVSALCDLPLAVSPVMIGLAFLLLIGRQGLLAPVLEALDLRLVFSFPGLVIATLFVTLPYTVREVVYVLEERGTEEEEAAATLGASPIQTFFRVTLPGIRVALGYGLLMAGARTLGEFGAVLVLGGSISGHTQTATTFIHDSIEERDLASAYGMALLLGALSILLLSMLEVLKKRDARARKSIRFEQVSETTS